MNALTYRSVLLLSRGLCCMVNSFQWSRVKCSLLSLLHARCHFAQLIWSSSRQIKVDFTGSFFITEGVKNSTVNVFLRNVGLYIYFSVVRIIRGMFVRLPRAPSLKWGRPLAPESDWLLFSPPLTCPVIWNLSVCFSLTKHDFVVKMLLTVSC